MARQDSETLWIAIGALGAMALGVALIPLRTLTSASNLAFGFLALTIVVAELGGRTAGLATAVVSALSLNFFLTEPYLRLTINRSDDIIAFVALAVSGLIAAAFGRRRARSSEMLGRAREDIDALERLADGLTRGASLEAALENLRRAFRLALRSRSRTTPQHGQGEGRSARESECRWPPPEQS
jgi:K+-sensing histidine kinase KdpD